MKTSEVFLKAAEGMAAGGENFSCNLVARIGGDDAVERYVEIFSVENYDFEHEIWAAIRDLSEDPRHCGPEATHLRTMALLFAHEFAKSEGR